MKEKIRRHGRVLPLFVAGAVAVSGLTGCGGSTASSSGASVSGSSGDGSYAGQTLSVYTWPEYIPDSVLSDFEDKYGVKVNLTTFDSNEEMLSKVQASADGTYDIVMPSDYMVKDMIDEGMLAELDMKALTNFKNLDEQYLDQEYDPGNKYSVPFSPGMGIPCYNKAELGDGAITKLSDLFDSKYENGIVILDEVKEIIGMTNKSLGYSLNETDPDKLANTEKMLEELKKNVYTMTIEATQEYLLSGEVSVGYMYNGNVAMGQLENEDIVAVWPEEGSYKWVDNICILKSSKKQELANLFINYILDADVDVKIRTEIPSADPNAAGWAKMDDKYKKTALVIPQDCWDKSEFAATLDDETNELYTRMWTEFTQ
ncbi:MAG: polyamine ABC transporter substrate-binding protein [Bilifractor sp.]